MVASLALGLVLSHRTSGVVNFAHAAMGMLRGQQGAVHPVAVEVEHLLGDGLGSVALVDGVVEGRPLAALGTPVDGVELAGPEALGLPLLRTVEDRAGRRVDDECPSCCATRPSPSTELAFPARLHQIWAPGQPTGDE